MSMDIAKKLLQDLLADKALAEAFTRDPEAFLTAGGYDCTSDELKEAKTLDRKLDENELKAFSSGTCWTGMCEGKGGCTTSYFAEQCTATVEEHSFCWNNDYCFISSCGYHWGTVNEKESEKK